MATAIHIHPNSSESFCFHATLKWSMQTWKFPSTLVNKPETNALKVGRLVVTGCDVCVSGKSKTACPFQVINKREIPSSKLVSEDGSLDNDIVIVVVDLKNVRQATQSEIRPIRSSMHTINLEVIDHDSITRAMNGGAGCIISPTRKRNSDVCSGSLVRVWARQVTRCPHPLISISVCFGCLASG